MSHENEVTVPVTLNLSPGVKAELDYLIKLHRQNGAPNQYDSVESLLEYVASAVADGSRRPGAWERSIIESMGLVPECHELKTYRAQYGEPAAAGSASAG